MVQKRNALGRGLDALLSMDEVQTEGSSSINEIELSKIAVNPNQPRRSSTRQRCRSLPILLQRLVSSSLSPCVSCPMMNTRLLPVNAASAPRKWQG